jgi:hypothetical protein
MDYVFASVELAELLQIGKRCVRANRPYAASLVASGATATRSGVPRTIFICFQS